ncbi:MAG: fused MFS/spermidine synthase [Betaproteobacteria bacterium]|nr:fused MFS/spermidine synthase [Betaproteobacteria bacterium]
MNALARPALYALFTVSGFAGLIYESVWSHYLRNYLGHAAHGQSVVLAIFVGGLALGAWLAGRYSHRLREPLLAYAAAELAIALAAFAFHPLFVAVTGWSYETLLPATCGESGACVTQWVVAALLIAAPAIALGATFPWMAAGVLRRWPRTPGHEISVLYFANSMGAVLGVLASAFWLVPRLGLPGTVAVAGALNLAVAAAVAAIAWRRTPAPESAPAEEPPAPKAKRGKAAKAAAASAEASPAPVAAPRLPSAATPSLVRSFLAVAALTGFASFVYEIVWIRMLSLVLGSSTQSFEIMLAAFILGLALGAAWIRGRIDVSRDTRALLGHVQILMGVAAALTLPLYDVVFDAYAWLFTALARTPAGYGLYHGASAAIALFVMLPATFLAGMTLPLITHRLLASGAGERAIGEVYAANTLGAIAGVVLATHVLMPSLGLKGALLAGAAVDVLVGVWLLRRPKGELAFSWPGFATVVVGLGALAAIAAAVQLDPRRMASGPYRTGTGRLPENVKLVSHADGKTATVSVIDAGDVRMLITNGKTDASMAMRGQAPSADEPTQVLAGALAIGAHPQAKRIAVVGVGSGITSATLLGSPAAQRVDTIEIERRMLEGAKHFAERNAAIWSDERSHFVIDDAKAFLARSALPYDIIVSEPSNPWVSGVASLFTEETYARFARHLAPGGVLVQWLQLYDTEPALVSSVFRALVRHFPYHAIHVSGGDLVILASRERTPRVDAAALFRMPDVAVQLRASGLGTPADVDEGWRGNERTTNALLAAYDAPANSDYAPYLEANAARARFLGGGVSALFETRAPVPMLEMLGGGAPAATPPLSAALADALSAPPEAAPALAPEFAPFADALRAARELLRTCRPGGPVPLLLEGAVGVAMEINRLPAARAGAAWAAVKSGPCYAKLDSGLRTWVDLFAAVGARDANAMATLGARAAQEAPGAFAHDYAVAAAATGDVALGRTEMGAVRLDALQDRGQQPWAVILRQVAAGRTIAPKPAS